MNRRLFDFEALLEDVWGLGRYNDLSIKNEGAQYRVMLDVPGFSKEDIELTLNNDTFTIKAENKIRKTDRSYTLPVDIDASKVEAILENGVLTVVLPKSTKSRKVEITVK